MKINRLFFIGVLLILIGILIFKWEFLDQFITLILWPILSGSSRGKTVLLFMIIGTLLVLNSILIHFKIGEKTFLNKGDGKKYLKLTLILIFLTYIMAIIIEVYLRLKMGVSIFTIFVAEDPTPSSTSIMHSHVFKSTLGYLLNIFGETSASNINTGFSLIKYVYPPALIGFITIPLAYITGLLSLNNGRDSHKIILVFVLSLSIISMMDGGIFSQPAIVGIFGLLVMYFIKKPFHIRQLIKPIVVILLIILVGLGLEISGTNHSYHELTVINQTENVDMGEYNVLSEQKMNDKRIYIIKPATGDKETLERLFKTYNNTANGYFMTWDISTYI